MRLCDVGEQYLTLRVGHKEIGACGHKAPVQKHGIGVSQLAQRHTVRKLPQRKPCLGDIRLSQRGHAQLLAQKGKALPLAQLPKHLHGNRVDRIGKRGGYVGQPVVGKMRVTRPGLVPFKAHGHVVVHACPVDQALFQRGRIERKRLDGRAGRQLDVGGVILHAVGALCPVCACHTKDISGCGINDDHARALVALKNICACKILLHDLLHALVQSSVNAQAARIHQGTCRRTGIPVPLAQIAHHILHDHILVPRRHAVFIA